MRAVATVVMNRVRVPNGEYHRVCEGDLRRVIIQACQFSCYKTMIGGVENTQNVWTSTPEDIHYQVADWAINGGIYTGAGSSALWYMVTAQLLSEFVQAVEPNIRTEIIHFQATPSA